jgi:hypothetical protein
MHRLTIGLAVVLTLIVASSCDRSGLTVNGRMTVDGPVDVRGALLVNGPLTVTGPVAAAHFHLDGPLIPNAVDRQTSGRAVKVYQGRLVVNGPFEVGGALNVAGTLTVRGPLICDSTTERKPAQYVSDGSDFLGFHRLQRLLGLPIN